MWGIFKPDKNYEYNNKDYIGQDYIGKGYIGEKLGAVVITNSNPENPSECQKVSELKILLDDRIDYKDFVDVTTIHQKSKDRETRKIFLAKSKYVHFDGCAKKDKNNKIESLYYNCKGFNRARYSPPPPCKKGFVKISESVPVDKVQGLQRCVYIL